MRIWSRSSRTRLLVLVAAAIAVAACSVRSPRTSLRGGVTKAVRLRAIQRAQVWTSTDVARMDLRQGPQGRDAFAPFAKVACTYVERKMDGTSPKFACELAPGDEAKIKYGADNPEVYAEVAASRLLWALGFGADRWYPVSVTCHGCPADPRKDIRATTSDVVFDTAALERPLAGKTIETRSDEGWSWQELDLVREEMGGAPRRERDALKLLAVLMQHTDSKPEQQRLVCLKGGEDAPFCATPFMFIHDVGLTFGHANLFNTNKASGVNLEEWSKAPVWHDERTCVGNLPKSTTGTLWDPVVSEEGRRFLADLLGQLTDRQLRDLFEVARFPERSHADVDAWVAAFKKKRDEISSVSCPA